MKILMVSTFDIQGGAARAAYRLHRGLLNQGVQSKMLVQKKTSIDPNVIQYPDFAFGKIYNKVSWRLSTSLVKLQMTSNGIIHSLNIFPSGLHRQINSSDADIVHLHWLGYEMISIRELAKIKKPIVWTFHDMWAFCGAEHYDNLDSPERYKEGYFKNNRPVNHEGIDIDRWTWKRKKQHWRNKDFNIITPSNWLADCAKESDLLEDKNIQSIPNGLNLDLYKPIHTDWARKILNIENDNQTKYILFGAMSATSDERKGYKQLKEALFYLKNNNNNSNYRLLVFGSEGHEGIDFGFNTTYLGRLSDSETLALAYSAADVMMVPSLQDNLPNTAVEAIACGTPVVAFNIGGLPDIINHKENGYLAKSYNAEDLAKGISWILEDVERNKRLGKRSRLIAEEKFDINKVAHRYIEVFQNILKK